MKRIIAGCLISLVAVAAWANGPELVSISKANSDPENFANRHVSVEGYLILGDHSRAFNGDAVIFESKKIFQAEDDLFRSQDSFDPKPYLKYCLTIINSDRLDNSPEFYDHQTVKLVGTLIYYGGSPYQCGSPLALKLD